MIIQILLELVKVLEVIYNVIADRVGIDEAEKDKLVISFAKFKEFVDQFSHDNNPNH